MKTRHALLAPTLKAPAEAGKMKEEKNKSATRKKQGTEMAQS